jgi:hypothetical protein
MVEKKWPWLSDKDQRDFAFLHGGENRVNSPRIIYLFRDRISPAGDSVVCLGAKTCIEQVDPAESMYQ